MCPPDPNDNAEDKGARVRGLNSTTDEWEDVLSDGSGALLVNNVGGGGDSNVSIASPLVQISQCAVVVNITQSDAVPVNVTQVDAITVDVTNVLNISQTDPITVNVTNNINFTQTVPIKVDITAGGGGDSNVQIAGPLVQISQCAVVVNITQSDSVPVNVTQVDALTVNVTNALNITQANPLTVQVSNTAPIAVDITAGGFSNVHIASPLVQISQCAMVVNITQSLAVPVNVTNALNITQTNPLTVNVTNALNVTQANPLTVNVTAGTINVTQTDPLTVNMTAGGFSNVHIAGPLVQISQCALVVNITQSLAVPVNVTNALNITQANPLTVNVTNALNVTQTNPLTVNVTSGLINITQTNPVTVNVTNNLNITNAVFNVGDGDDATNASITSASVGLVIASNSNRKFLFLTNVGDFDCYLSLGNSNAAIESGILIKRRGGALLLDTDVMCKNAIHGIATGNTTIAIQNGT